MTLIALTKALALVTSGSLRTFGIRLVFLIAATARISDPFLIVVTVLGAVAVARRCRSNESASVALLLLWITPWFDAPLALVVVSAIAVAALFSVARESDLWSCVITPFAVCLEHTGFFNFVSLRERTVESLYQSWLARHALLELIAWFAFLRRFRAPFVVASVTAKLACFLFFACRLATVVVPGNNLGLVVRVFAALSLGIAGAAVPFAIGQSAKSAPRSCIAFVFVAAFWPMLFYITTR